MIPGKIRILAPVLLVLLLQGCMQQTVRIESEPPGAIVVSRGQEIGTTPTEIVLDDAFPLTWTGLAFHRSGSMSFNRPGCEQRVLSIDDDLVSSDIHVKLRCDPGAVVTQPEPVVPVQRPQQRRDSSPAHGQRLQRLDDLRSQGLITEEEYRRIRKRILDSL